MTACFDGQTKWLTPTESSCSCYNALIYIPKILKELNSATTNTLYSDINLLQLRHIENKIWKASPYHGSFDNDECLKLHNLIQAEMSVSRGQWNSWQDLDTGEEEEEQWLDDSLLTSTGLYVTTAITDTADS